MKTLPDDLYDTRQSLHGPQLLPLPLLPESWVGRLRPPAPRLIAALYAPGHSATADRSATEHPELVHAHTCQCAQSHVQSELSLWNYIWVSVCFFDGAERKAMEIQLNQNGFCLMTFKFYGWMACVK
jgi:hypothetical protein